MYAYSEFDPWTKANKGFFSPIFCSLVRALEDDIIEYEIVRGNSRTNLYHMLLQAAK